MVTRKVLYFEAPGKENTEDTIKVVKKTAIETGIQHVVVASGTGSTGVKVSEALRDAGIKVVVVTEHAGQFKFGTSEPLIFSEASKKKLKALGVEIVTCTHAFSGPISSHPSFDANSVIRDTLTRFCQGMKVAVEIVMMAADAGAILVDEEVIAVAGTLEGADTAIIVRPCHAKNFFDKEHGIEIRQILCMPIRKVFW